MTAPIPTDLDQAVINAGLDLIHAELDPDRDEQRIADAQAAYKAALDARWPNA